MKIERVQCQWIHCPIEPNLQHVSDFGVIDSFDMALVRIDVEGGLIGWGESKASVGSAGDCSSLVSIIETQLGPAIVGEDARNINRIWDLMYNGVRGHYAIDRGRGFPSLGRRGHQISAMSGIDMALWDCLGKSLDSSVASLWGGPRQQSMPVYASGGWANEDNIGEQLQGYVDSGFNAVKMRVGVMDGNPRTSAARVRAAREALGPEIGLMADAHGTFSPNEAIRFVSAVEDCELSWFEEPCNSDDLAGGARVRAATQTPISVGESLFTRFDFRDVIEHGIADVLQPDLAIMGGPTEARRVAALAETHQLELAPHCWGSAFSFAAGVSLAFTSSTAQIIEYSLGGNPLLHDLVKESPPVADGRISAPTGPGWGLTPNQSFIETYTRS